MMADGMAGAIMLFILPDIIMSSQWLQLTVMIIEHPSQAQVLMLNSLLLGLTFCPHFPEGLMDIRWAHPWHAHM